MATFYIGETIICNLTIKDSNRNLVDPDTVPAITINSSSGTAVVDKESMKKDSTGLYHYDFQTEDASAGVYGIVYKVTDSTRVTILKDSLELA